MANETQSEHTVLNPSLVCLPDQYVYMTQRPVENQPAKREIAKYMAESDAEIMTKYGLQDQHGYAPQRPVENQQAKGKLLKGATPRSGPNTA